MIIAAKRSLSAAQGVFLAAGVGALMWVGAISAIVWLVS